MNPDIAFYAVALLAVILLGFSKGGFVGVGALSTPMMSLVTSPFTAAAILLPILIVQDLVGMWAFRKTWDRKILAIMLPGAGMGISLGYVTATKISATAVLGTVGALSICFGLYQL